MWLRTEPGGAEWLEELPSIVQSCASRWELDIEEPFEGQVSYVAPATTKGGAEVVLKVNYPSDESRHEGRALEHWQGRGAVRLLEEDHGSRALLLERCRPGRRLWHEAERDATEAMIEVLRRLWERRASAGPFESLQRASSTWCEHLTAAWEAAEGPFEEALLQEAVAFMLGDTASVADDVVLHQDLHGGNVLLQEGTWVAIDPKPLAGERAFDLTSYLRDRRDQLANDPDAVAVVRTRLDTLCAALDLDRERARGWGIAHCLAWGFDASGAFYPDHVMAARLLMRC